MTLGRPRSHPDPMHLRDSRKNLYYRLWRSIKQRCYDPTNKDYRNYGGRGVLLDTRWHDFDVFVCDILESIGPKPEGATLDRVDNNGNYGPGKVKWSTAAEQGINRRPPERSGKSPYRGVVYNSRMKTKQWTAFYYPGGEYKHIGNFASPEEAARARDRFSLSLYGPDYNGFNFPKEVVDK